MLYVCVHNIFLVQLIITICNTRQVEGLIDIIQQYKIKCHLVNPAEMMRLFEIDVQVVKIYFIYICKQILITMIINIDTIQYFTGRGKESIQINNNRSLLLTHCC